MKHPKKSIKISFYLILTLFFKILPHCRLSRAAPQYILLNARGPSQLDSAPLLALKLHSSDLLIFTRLRTHKNYHEESLKDMPHNFLTWPRIFMLPFRRDSIGIYILPMMLPSVLYV